MRTVPIPLTIAPSCTVAYSSLAIGTGPVSRTRAPYSPAKFEIGRRLPDRVGGILAGLQRVVVELRLELDEGAAVGIGQRLVADEFAPGERRRALVQDVLDRLADQVEGPFGIVELDLPALDAGKPGLQRAGQAADRGIAGHDLDQGRGGFELAGRPCRPPPPAGTAARSFRRTRRNRAAAPIRNSWCRRSVLRPAPCSRRWRVPASAPRPRRESVFSRSKASLELVVALAPVEIGRNQRVDVGVDGEMAGRIEARPDRQKQARG